jgi:aminoglycoside phosphotransferase (APT) family kinase protein
MDIGMAVDYRRTACRPQWTDLPESVRDAVSAKIGPVSGVVVAGSGFTPAFAATVTGDAGRLFVKAAPLSSEFGATIAHEATVLAALPEGLPVPRLAWSSTVDGWAVLGLDVVDGHMPGHPWTASDLVAALDSWAAINAVLADPPERLRAVASTESFAEYLDQHGSSWSNADMAGLPASLAAPTARHLPELVECESLLREASRDAAGLLHFDLRPDNLLIRTGTRTAVVVDWNWLKPGPTWMDTVLLLVTAFGEADVDALLAAHPTTRDVPTDLVDAALGVFAGIMLKASSRPVVPTSPSLRAHQRGQTIRALTWLARRRRW